MINDLGSNDTPKYVVFKSDEWQAIIDSFTGSGKEWTEVVQAFDKVTVDDAEVIRHQDVTAAPVFHLYANLIHSFIDLVPTSDNQRLDLMAIADHFHEAAMKSEVAPHRKLPD